MLFNCLLSVATTKPNFLVLFLDDHGWGDVGANWNETTETPRMDQLAAEGVRFTDFHASYSVCTASRGALLTGRLAPRTGVASNFGPYSTHGMALQERTIANELNDLGYESHMIGKVSYLADTESAILSLTLPILHPCCSDSLLVCSFSRTAVASWAQSAVPPNLPRLQDLARPSLLRRHGMPRLHSAVLPVADVGPRQRSACVPGSLQVPHECVEYYYYFYYYYW